MTSRSQGAENMKEGEQGRRRDEEEDGGTIKPKVGRILKALTRRELEAHLPLHIPYQAWGPTCVASEGMHYLKRKTREEDAERIGVAISLDY